MKFRFATFQSDPINTMNVCDDNKDVSLIKCNIDGNTFEKNNALLLN